MGKIKKQNIDPDSFQVTWNGKQQAIESAYQDCNCSLIEDIKRGSLGHEHNHQFIVGDNLKALQALLPKYKNNVNQIYIDPPYNTGKQFVYKDHFKSTGSWHNMMLPRLILAKALLTQDGVIFVSIDDHELASLKMIMDEVFGKENYIEIFSWVKSATPANLSRKSKKVLEYVLCYQKVKNPQKFKGVKKQSPSSNGLLNQANQYCILNFPKNIVNTKIEDGPLMAGNYGTDNYQIELLENTLVKDGLFIKPIILRAKFKWTQTKLDKELKNGTIISIPTLKLSPSYDKLSYDPEVPPNLIDHRVGVTTNEIASANLTKLMGANVFDYPKPLSLIKYLLGFTDNKKNIILDFFAGSAATMQAVMEMNNDDAGQRTCICVQNEENIHGNTIASANGYNTIAEIGIERISRFLATQYPLGHQPKSGFQVMELKDSDEALSNDNQDVARPTIM